MIHLRPAWSRLKRPGRGEEMGTTRLVPRLGVDASLSVEQALFSRVLGRVTREA